MVKTAFQKMGTRAFCLLGTFLFLLLFPLCSPPVAGEEAGPVALSLSVEDGKLGSQGEITVILTIGEGDYSTIPSFSCLLQWQGGDLVYSGLGGEIGSTDLWANPVDAGIKLVYTDSTGGKNPLNSQKRHTIKIKLKADPENPPKELAFSLSQPIFSGLQGQYLQVAGSGVKVHFSEDGGITKKEPTPSELLEPGEAPTNPLRPNSTVPGGSTQKVALSGPSLWWLIAGIAVGVFAAGAAGWYFWNRRRKKQAEEKGGQASD